MPSSIYFLSDFTFPVECGVCLDEYKYGDVLIILPCRHFFCKKCITDWIKKKNICPTCRNDNFNKPLHLSESDIVNKLEGEYKDYIKGGGDHAPEFKLIDSDLGKITIYLDFDFDIDTYDYFKLVAKDIETDKIFVYDWTKMNLLNHTFITITENLVNLNCITLYLKKGFYHYRFHLKYDMFHTDNFKSHIFIKVREQTNSLTITSNINMFGDTNNSFMWGIGFKYGHKYPRFCVFCNQESGVYNQLTNCKSKYKFECECADEFDINCCKIL